MSQATRAYVYRIVLAVLAVAAAYGLLSTDELPAWVEAAAAVLAIGSNGLAVRHTSTKETV